MEALEENVYVTELALVNTGILDKIAHALAKTLKRNRTLEKVSFYVNFIYSSFLTVFNITDNLQVFSFLFFQCLRLSV